MERKEKREYVHPYVKMITVQPISIICSSGNSTEYEFGTSNPSWPRDDSYIDTGSEDGLGDMSTNVP